MAPPAGLHPARAATVLALRTDAGPGDGRRGNDACRALAAVVRRASEESITEAATRLTRGGDDGKRRGGGERGRKGEASGSGAR